MQLKKQFTTRNEKGMHKIKHLLRCPKRRQSSLARPLHSHANTNNVITKKERASGVFASLIQPNDVLNKPYLSELSAFLSCVFVVNNYVFSSNIYLLKKFRGVYIEQKQSGGQMVVVANGKVITLQHPKKAL